MTSHCSSGRCQCSGFVTCGLCAEADAATGSATQAAMPQSPDCARNITVLSQENYIYRAGEVRCGSAQHGSGGGSKLNCRSALPAPTNVSGRSLGSTASARSDTRRVGEECVVRVALGGRRTLNKNTTTQKTEPTH